VDTALDLGRPAGRLPASVTAEIERRRAPILQAATGRVLDLDDPAGRAVLVAALATPASVTEPYDTIVSTGALTTWPDLRAALVAIDRLLADDGELRLVEPVNHPGLWGLLVGSACAGLPAGRGRYLLRDVVATVRSVGLTAADIDRFTIRTGAWPLRRWVDVRAVRIPSQVGPEESVAPA
jgi:hypothetical protein